MFDSILCCTKEIYGCKFLNHHTKQLKVNREQLDLGKAKYI